MQVAASTLKVGDEIIYDGKKCTLTKVRVGAEFVDVVYEHPTMICTGYYRVDDKVEKV